MIVQDMIAAINRRIDDTISTTDAVEFLNAGQNVLAMEVGATFSQLSVTNLNGTFDFDEKYHEIPVIYACMRFKELDSVLTEAQNYRAQFLEMKKFFIQNYQMPVYNRDDRLSQQFVAQEGQSAFIITKDTFSPQRGVLKVYKNGSGLVTWTQVYPAVATVTVNGKTYTSAVNDASLVTTTLTSTNDPRGFILTYPCSLGDVITATWEEHNDIVEPPYAWWSGQGW